MEVISTVVVVVVVVLVIIIIILLLTHAGMPWIRFKRYFSQYFKVSCAVERSLADFDYELLW